jgi:hypothetical protein
MGSAVVSTACTLLVRLARTRARPDPDRRISPWEQGLTLGPDPERPQFDNLHEAREHFDFDCPASSLSRRKVITGTSSRGPRITLTT